MQSKKYTGGCLCGKVQYEITGDIKNIVYCHCSQCRKVQGSAFATNGVVKTADFHFINGKNEITGYESTPGQTKYFCRHCGSPILSSRKSVPDEVRIRVGTIDTDIEEKPVAHIFVDSKANWEDIAGDLPQFPEYETSR